MEQKFGGGGGAKPALSPGGAWHLRAPHGGGGGDAHEALGGVSARRRPENWHALVEAETNPPYQPFHTDRRVTLLAFVETELALHKQQQPAPPPPVGHDADSEDADAEEEKDRDESAVGKTDWERDMLAPWLCDTHHVSLPGGGGLEHVAWLFGREIPAARVFPSAGNSAGVDASDDDDSDAVENKIRVVEGAEGEQVIVTTMRRKGRDEEFFEDGCEVVDFADDRV
jgi:hypothetical protein